MTQKTLFAIVAALVATLGLAGTTGFARTSIALGRCGGQAVTILGTDRADTLRGTPGPDVIKGLGGNDVIRGLGGNDIICAGQGDDEVYGQGGADTINGEGGLDRLFGGPGRDTVNGGPQNDVISGDSGGDTLNGQAGFDQLDFSASPNPILGEMNGVFSGWGIDSSAGFESLVGSQFNDALSGTAAVDSINGLGGDDLILNTAVIHGLDASNTFLGGEGDDTVSYANSGSAVNVSTDFASDSATVGHTGGTDQLIGVERIIGSDTHDTMVGSDGTRLLHGRG